MFCFPYKVTTGNFIEALDNGANTLLMYDSQGSCKLRHYHKLQELALKNRGYNFEIYGVSGKNIVKVLKKLSGKSTIKVMKEVYLNFPKKLKELEAKKNHWSKEKPNIGLIGEIFCSIDETINYNLEDKIKSYGVNTFNTVSMGAFIGNNLYGKKYIPFIKDEKKEYKKEASKYFNGETGGHAFENVYNLLELVDKKVDGVIHVTPLSCSPEILAESVINHICKENKVPLLRVPIDENFAELNLETRLEVFTELIKMRRQKNG